MLSCVQAALAGASPEQEVAIRTLVLHLIDVLQLEIPLPYHHSLQVPETAALVRNEASSQEIMTRRGLGVVDRTETPAAQLVCGWQSPRLPSHVRSRGNRRPGWPIPPRLERAETGLMASLYSADTCPDVMPQLGDSPVGQFPGPADVMPQLGDSPVGQFSNPDYITPHDEGQLYPANQQAQRDNGCDERYRAGDCGRLRVTRHTTRDGHGRQTQAASLRSRLRSAKRVPFQQRMADMSFDDCTGSTAKLPRDVDVWLFVDRLPVRASVRAYMTIRNLCVAYSSFEITSATLDDQDVSLDVPLCEQAGVANGSVIRCVTSNVKIKVAA